MGGVFWSVYVAQNGTAAAYKKVVGLQVLASLQSGANRYSCRELVILVVVVVRKEVSEPQW